MPISSLYFTNVGPFDEIEFEFDPQVNVFTGANNSGKSTVLWVLGELLVYPLTMPGKIRRADNAIWKLGYMSENGMQSLEGDLPTTTNHVEAAFQSVGYTCFVPAQRHGTDFRSSGPTAGDDADAVTEDEVAQIARARPEILKETTTEQLRLALQQFRSSEDPELTRRRRLLPTDPSMVNDEAIIQRIVNLEYDSFREKRPAKWAIVESIASLASEIVKGYPIDSLEVGKDENGYFPQLSTPDGVLPLNVLSQGTQSIVHCLARLLIGYAEYYDFPTDLREKPGILMIDEIDAHLHPSWQRRIIPTLTQHFPKLQIFCSTHSPMMLAGLKAGQVQLLRRDAQDKVMVSTNESDVAGWTADEILRILLEVPNPTDATTAEHVERLQELRRQGELNAEEAEELQDLRKIVSGELLSGPMSSQVEQFAEELKRARGESTS